MAEEAATFLGIDVDTAARLWDRTLDLYIGDAGEDVRLETERRARILGCIRIIAYFDRYREIPEWKMGIETCIRDIMKEVSRN